MRRGYLLPFCEGTDHIDQSLVRFAVLRAEPWNTAAEIRAVELRICIDLASQKAFAERAKRNEANPKLFQRGHHRLFGLSPEQRVLALERSDGLNCVGSANCLCARF